MLKQLKVQRYTLKTEKPVFGRMAILADLHYFRKMRDEKLVAILRAVRSLRPGAIVCAGDFVDSESEVAEAADYKRLHDWLASLARVAPVAFGFGNHDFYGKKVDGVWKDAGGAWVRKLADIERLSIMDQEHPSLRVSMSYGTVECRGIRLPRSYYGEGSLLRPAEENGGVLLWEMPVMRPLPESEVFSVMVVHSPVWLGSSVVRRRMLSGCDLVVSGHMHNGCVPPPLDRLLPGDRGIVAPSRKLLAPRCRGLVGSNLIAAPLTTFPASVWDNLFNVNITCVDIQGSSGQGC